MDERKTISGEQITQAKLDAFLRATSTQHGSSFPPTFATLFRGAEFEFLRQKEVDMHNLLHTDQEYEYHSDFQVGDEPQICSWICEDRQRRGMRVFIVQSEISVQGTLRVVSRSSFFIHSKLGKTK